MSSLLGESIVQTYESLTYSCCYLLNFTLPRVSQRESRHETSEPLLEKGAIINLKAQSLCSNLLFESIGFDVVLLSARRKHKRAFNQPNKQNIFFIQKMILI